MENVSYVERLIIEQILGAADARFLSIAVYDGEEWAVKSTRDYSRVKPAIGATDETTLGFKNLKGEKVGSVLLIHGNGHEVIGDYSTMAAEIVGPALALADTFQL